MEQLQSAPSAAVQWPPGSSEGHCVVPPPTRAAGVRGRHRRPLLALLEHADGSGAAEHRHWLPGLQPGMVQTCQWTGEEAHTHKHTHSWMYILEKQYLCECNNNNTFNKFTENVITTSDKKIVTQPQNVVKMWRYCKTNNTVSVEMLGQDLANTVGNVFTVVCLKYRDILLHSTS